MLPFDNKSEFQVIVDMPEGTTLEETARVDVGARPRRRSRMPTVVNVQPYVGTASPYNFNGLVRHYFLRQAPHLADLQVNLRAEGRAHRAEPRHRQAGARAPAADRRAARRDDQGGRSAARPAGAADAGGRGLRAGRRRDGRPSPARSRRIFEQTPGVVDVDWYVEAPQPKATPRGGRREGRGGRAVAGEPWRPSCGWPAPARRPACCTCEQAREDVPIVLRLPRERDAAWRPFGRCGCSGTSVRRRSAS